jgi:lipopolysaccharide/colanic/teichoic acid biosynthesis glycosyltransferase
LGDDDAAVTTYVAAPAARVRPLAGSRRKRTFDVALVVVTLPLTLPVGALLGLAVRLTSRGPAIFRQERVGRGGERFAMYKFRTMVVDAEERLARDPELRALYLSHDHKVPAKLDPRVTRLGRFLRVTSLDELPQLLNVMEGTMSLVGPRPITQPQYDEVEPLLDAYRAARPGMTGYWQVTGRSLIPYPERAEYDAHYVRNWSLRRDLMILLQTPMAVVRKRGAV